MQASLSLGKSALVTQGAKTSECTASLRRPVASASTSKVSIGAKCSFRQSISQSFSQNCSMGPVHKKTSFAVFAEAAEAEAPVKEDTRPDSGRMGPPIQAFDAIIEIGGAQQIVSKGRYYSCQNLNLKPGTEISLERVLAVKETDKLHVGRPYVEGATVQATIMENYKDKKVIVYKMKAKKHYRKKEGHRALMTRFLITDVTMP